MGNAEKAAGGVACSGEICSENGEIVEGGQGGGITGKEDPRKLVHSLKVGFTITLTSPLCQLEPVFHGLGQNSIWAIIIVIVVLEFIAGATLYKELPGDWGLCSP